MLIYLKVKPNQRFDRIGETSDGWEVRLHAPPAEGRANERLIDFLAEILGIAPGRIRIRKGLRSRVKGVEIDAPAEFIETMFRKSVTSAEKPAR